MDDLRALFDLGPDGAPLNREPLASRGFWFRADRRVWGRMQKFFEVGMPRLVARATMAAEIGVPEAVIEAWEAAMVAAEGRSQVGAEELLRVSPDGAPVSANPLIERGFQFFPKSRVWRRTRSHRDEVTREQVAKKIGVPVELVEAWESAACRAA